MSQTRQKLDQVLQEWSNTYVNTQMRENNRTFVKQKSILRFGPSPYEGVV